jgi:UDP-N-acetylmuramyl pentapeptide phosphotransferase/UDP-N-acetylglucosamine-1-phosphate transferase
MPEWIWPGISAVIAWTGGVAVIRLAPSLGVIDSPNERSSHETPTPRAGGIGFVTAVTLCGLPVGIEPPLQAVLA